MVDEDMYSMAVTRLSVNLDNLFYGVIIRDATDEIVYEFENENEEDVNNCLKAKLAYLNKSESAKTDSPDVQYYQQGGIECKDYLEAKGFAEGFYRGSAIKYITRAGKKCKDTEIQDLEKARDFINFEIERLNKLK